MATPPDTIVPAAAAASAPALDHPIGHAIGRVALSVGAYLGTIKAADLQVGVAIVGGLGVALYTWMNAYVLWRDKVRRRESLGGTD